MISDNTSDLNQNKKPSLTSKVVKSAGWVFAEKFVGRIFEVIKAIVLARLLTPEYFGLFGLVMLAIIVIDTFSQTGMKAALIQHDGDTKKYLNTAWTVQVIRGLTIGAILFLTAPLVGWFFKDPRIVQLLRVMCIVPVTQGFINIAIIYFEKELEFQRQFLYEMISNIVSLFVGILLAYMTRSVWALIWANIAGVIMRLIMSYVLLPYRPHFRLLKSQIFELFQFGKWISGYSMVLFGWQQLDKFFVGKVLGPGALGLYQLAQRISDMPISNIAIASVNFTFPAYSKIQYERERLKKAFLDIFETVMSLVLPIVVFIFFAASDIVYGLLGEKWQGSILPLKILSIAGFLTAFDIISTPLLLSTGNPKIEFWKNLFKFCIMAVTIYPMTLIWGLPGSCVALVISSLSVLPIWVKVKSIVCIGWSDIFLRLFAPFALALGIASMVILIHAVVRINNALSLTLALFASMFIYILISIFAGRKYGRGIYIHMRRIVKSLSAI